MHYLVYLSRQNSVYESYSNYNASSSSAWMYIDIEGYDTFTIYVRSYAESGYDGVIVYNLDSTSDPKINTRNSQRVELLFQVILR